MLNTANLLGAFTNLTAIAAVNVTCTVQFKDETATGAGPRWPGSRNWFMYTPCTTSGSVDLIAGQNYDAGDITFSTCEGDGMITITIALHSGFSWAPVSGNLKIHPMDDAPSKYVAPGKYDFKFDATTQTYSVSVPTAEYYAIHADVRRLVLN